MTTLPAPLGAYCFYCNFWTDKGQRKGWCHRHAPKPSRFLPTDPEGIVETYTLWPATDCLDTCGDGQFDIPTVYSEDYVKPSWQPPKPAPRPIPQPPPGRHVEDKKSSKKIVRH